MPVLETRYGRVLAGADGLAVPGSVFRFVRFPGAAGIQVEILSGSEQGMCRLVGDMDEADTALRQLGLVPIEEGNSEDEAAQEQSPPAA